MIFVIFLFRWWFSRVVLFKLDSNTDVSLGTVTQHGPGIEIDDGIFVNVTSGVLTVRSGEAVSALQGSIDLKVQLGSIFIGSGAEIAAEADGKNQNWGHVDILVVPSTVPSNGANGQFPNLTIFPSTSTFICGPNGLTANAPNNSLVRANRRLSLKGPLASSITLDGATKINALGQDNQ